MGHSGIPYRKSIYCEEGNRKLYRHVINAGSVGKPKHGNLDACYCLLRINRDSDPADPDSVQVDFRYVPYDVAQVIEKISDSGLTDAYNDYLTMNTEK